MKKFFKRLFPKAKEKFEEAMPVISEESISQKPMTNQDILENFLRKIDPPIEDLEFYQVFNMLDTSSDTERIKSCLVNIVEHTDSLYALLRYDRYRENKIPELQSALEQKTTEILCQETDTEELIRLVNEYQYGIVDMLIRRKISDLKSDIISKAEVNELIKWKKIVRNSPEVEKRMAELVIEALSNISISNINDIEILWAHSPHKSKSRELIDEKIVDLFSKMSNISDLNKLVEICNNSTRVTDFSHVESAASWKAREILSTTEDIKILRKLYSDLPYCHMVRIYISYRAIEIIKKTEFVFQDLDDLIAYKHTWNYCNVELFEKIPTQLLINNLKGINDISQLILYWSESAPRNFELTKSVRSRISELFSNMNYEDFSSLITRKPPEEFKDIFKAKTEEFLALLNR